MMELTQDVWWCLFVTHLDAQRWTFGLQDWADKGFICCFFCFLVSDFYVSSEEAECLVRFIGDGVYVEPPIQVVLYVYAKVFCCADVLQVVSV